MSANIVVESTEMIATGCMKWTELAVNTAVEIHQENIRKFFATNIIRKTVKQDLTKFVRNIKFIHTQIVESINILDENPQYFPIWQWKFICYMYGDIINLYLRKVIFRMLRLAYDNGYIKYRDARKCMRTIDRKMAI